MEFDPASSAQYIPDMIKNDTLIEVLDEDQLSECLKYITLNILDKVQSKYKIPDRFKAVSHIFTDFGEGNNFNSKKFVEFIKSLGRCLHFDILDSIATIIEATFSKIDHLSQKADTKPDTQTQQALTPHTQNRSINKNIEELKKIPKTKENFDKIYEICKRIVTENDKNAMSFVVREKFVYVTENDLFNVFTKAVCDHKQDLVRLLIESDIDINSRDQSNDTPLILASRIGDPEIVKILLAVPGIDINGKDKSNNTALIEASRNGHYVSVKLLLTVPGIDINARGYQNETALMKATKNNYHEVVKILKEHGAI